MKKILAWLMALIMLLGSAMAELNIPEEAAVLPMEEWTAIDMDGDGGAEKVLLKMEGIPDEACLRIIIEGTDGAMNIYDTLIMYPENCISMDISGDGIHEILLSGDMQSDDYVTYCLNYHLETGISALPFADANRGENTGEFAPEGYGKLIAISQNTVTLRGSQDVLGTWMADRSFALKDGIFEFGDEGMWIMQDITEDESIWEYYCLNPMKEVPVTLEDGSEGKLSIGEKFLIAFTDKAGIAGFITREGKRGTIAITENLDEGWGYMIDGIPDYEYFEYMPYAD